MRPHQRHEGRTVTGSVFYPLSQQIADNVAAHGYVWAWSYYMRRGVPDWEFRMLAPQQ
jgi:hypothetical protein